MSFPSNPTDPFGPPGHQPPQDPQAWAPVAQPGYAVPRHPAVPPHPVAHPGYAGPQHPFAPQPFAPAPKGGNGLAVAAVVMSGLALLGVLAIALFIGVGVASGGSPVLTGEVNVVDKGASYSDLQVALTTAVEDDGGTVDEIVCPERSQVGQGLVTVCHGSVDGFDWTGVVVFEDEDGTFVLTEY
ncbi:hypothetical protein SAMN04489867_3094 [Pedococcus dokdonensis]|uniref:DUF4333 domain-containing protein n=1 Tax=Pedococcus dokdonensis TaxID=443156 RepID=A0A1H0U2K0_9MICO|nr:hypothetical protein [Pedococcus dokdonensis]SDP60225.1 hypothetical protein SAMN04489867_3094 [Pedococcus dokdonensis]